MTAAATPARLPRRVPGRMSFAPFLILASALAMAGLIVMPLAVVFHDALAEGHIVVRNPRR